MPTMTSLMPLSLVSIRSGEQLGDHLAVDVGKAVIAALEAVGQLLVVQAEQVQNGRLEVMDVDRILDDVIAQLVSCAEGQAALDAAAGQPHGEGVRVVVAAPPLQAAAALG